MIGGIWSVPINLPFTRFNRGLRASARVRNFLKDLIAEKRMELKKGADPHQDLITCLLSTRDENNGEGMTEKEIVDNVILVLTAGHDN
jgi:cytochrome P450 family 26 subfamily A